ncbi:hypothetical protein BAG01nite_33570 [Brevibacillus agri]|uniref:WD40 repeat domain-containing protein n=1 Tax=Brevibacillus agri TaxID=51101 RepID=A0A3M8B6A5_9BACL|nr:MULTISPECIES: PD40 domain-containing protein [Brevibacillus]MDN4092272.1 PD40 domain-containing protein [Brevibacillus agri]QAV13797.1 hypothetical protein BA6348_14080 [Brevibacillus agri]QHZ56403.1 hypothetical protein M655_012465 [Brevibacillus sp. NSP2.1]RNB58813.1 hypothetical protein EB820_05395 [Brevibacillus agri]WHX28526.1 PD40 domain-containing protein [Brevibacillus agri]
MREEEKYPQGHNDDQTVAQLLTHLKRMRRSVPVNYQLKADLRKQLLERMKELEAKKGQAQGGQQPWKRRKLLWISCAALVVALSVGVCLWWGRGAVTIQKHEVLTLPAESSVEQVDIDRSATQIAYIAHQSELRTLPIDGDTKPATVKLPPTKGKYVAVAWSNQGKQIAVVEQAEQMSRLWIVELPTAYSMGSSRLLKEEEGVAYSSPSWSQHDDSIAYTRSKGGNDEIWVSSTISFQEWKLTEGSQPEWSPDGRFLAFRKEGAVQVMEMRTGLISMLGQGQWASWRSEQELTYTQPDGQLMVANVGDEPFVTKELQLRNQHAAELIRGNWAAKGKQILLISRESQPRELVVSLASR